MSKNVLILGASGRFGRATAEAFWNAGWQVRAFRRDQDDLTAAAKWADVIVNGWNPAYPDWAALVSGMTRNVIAAAEAGDATVIVPGNVYGYGPGSAGLIDDTTPMRATNTLGRIRIAMEDAYKASKVRTIILRAGDFIDTEPTGNWFDQIITAKAARGKIVSPGNPTAPHAWAYLPDLAQAVVALAEKRDSLDRFESVLFPGYTLSLADLAKLVTEATGVNQRVSRMSWVPLWLAALVWPMGRHLLEMRYLWNMPHRLDGSTFNALLPSFRPTEPLDAIKDATKHLGASTSRPGPDTRIQLHVSPASQ